MADFILGNRMKSFGRKEAIECTKNGTLEIPEGTVKLAVDFAYFVVREDLPRVHTLMIPASVMKIDSMRGDYSSGPYGYRNNPFSKIIVDEANEAYCSIDGVLFSKDKKTLICYPCGKEGEEYWVPKEVEIIETEAFLNVEHLERIHLPKNLIEIKEDAFVDCLKLDESVIEAFFYANE